MDKKNSEKLQILKIEGKNINQLLFETNKTSKNDSSNFERKNDFKIIDELAFKLGKEKSSNNIK